MNERKCHSMLQIQRACAYFQVTDIQKMFTAQPDSAHQTGDVLKTGRDDPAVPVLMSGQVFHDPGVNIRNIVGKGAVQHDQVCVEGVDQIIDTNGHIFHKELHYIMSLGNFSAVVREKFVNAHIFLSCSFTIFFQNGFL